MKISVKQFFSSLGWNYLSLGVACLHKKQFKLTCSTLLKLLGHIREGIELPLLNWYLHPER